MQRERKMYSIWSPWYAFWLSKEWLSWWKYRRKQPSIRGMYMKRRYSWFWIIGLLLHHHLKHTTLCALQVKPTWNLQQLILFSGFCQHQQISFLVTHYFVIHSSMWYMCQANMINCTTTNETWERWSGFKPPVCMMLIDSIHSDARIRKFENGRNLSLDENKNWSEPAMVF